MDAARKQTDKLLEEMEKKVRKEYLQASKEVEKTLNDYLQKFAEKDQKKQDALNAGLITQQEYNEWRTGQIITGKRWTALRDQLSADYVNADKIAKSIVNGYMPEVYALNHNYGTYTIEKQSKIDTAYTLYDRQTVERLMRDNPDMLPPPGKKVSKAIAEGRAIRWNNQHIQSVMTQSLLQGESINKIAHRLAEKVGDSDYKAAVRNARTITTRAENYGRLDSYKRAQKMGIDMKKQWVSTLDNVTRDSHVDLDGEVQDVDKPFSNGLDCPGGMGPPEEVYNCRCTMVAQLKGFEGEDYRKNQAIGSMSYDEWKQAARDRINERNTRGQNNQLSAEDRYKQAVENYKNIKNPTEDDLKAVGRALRERMQEVYGGIDKYDQLYKDNNDAYREYLVARRADDSVSDFWNKYNQMKIDEGYTFTTKDSVEEVKWNSLIKSAEKDTGLRIRLNGIDKQFKELGISVKDTDSVFDVINKTTDIMNSKAGQYNKLYAEYKEIRDKVTGKNAADALKGELAKVREMGVTQGMNLKAHLNNSRSPKRKVVEEAYNYYPTSWIKGSVDQGTLNVLSKNRGYYSHYNSEIAISGTSGDDSLRTALHELGHRYERTQGLKAFEKEFYDRRTAGETLQWLGTGYERDEKTRKDDFFDAYIGKDYGGNAYEIVSMGLEHAYMQPAVLFKDTDMTDFIYGLLSVR